MKEFKAEQGEPESQAPMTQAVRKRTSSLTPPPMNLDDETQTGGPLHLPSSDEAAPYIMVLCGPYMGRVFEIEQRSLVVGRGRTADVTLPDGGLSREHVKFIRYPGGVVAACDMHSLNGTFLNGEAIQTRSLQDGDKIQIGTSTVLKFGYRDSLEHQLQERLYNAATRDRLTGVYNKNFVTEALERETAAARRDDALLSLVLLDIDHFKQINDGYGHVHGDAVLSQLGHLLRAVVRDGDIVGRMGGEEFVVICRSAGHAQALALAERLRATIEAKLCRDPESGQALTASFGVATFTPSQHARGEDLFRTADVFLYQAKTGGRNQVASAVPLTEVAPDGSDLA